MVNELGQRTNSQDDFKTTVLKTSNTPAQSAQFISLPLFSMYLYCPTELPEKYTFCSLPSLQNKPEKMYIAIPPTLAVTLLGLGRKTKLLPGAILQANASATKQVTESVSTGKDLSKEKACLSLTHTSVKMKTRLTNQSCLKSWPSSASSKYPHTACYDMTCFQESIS